MSFSKRGSPILFPRDGAHNVISQRLSRLNSRARLVDRLWQLAGVVLGFVCLVLFLQNALQARSSQTVTAEGEVAEPLAESTPSAIGEELRVTVHALPQPGSDVLTTISTADSYRVVEFHRGWAKVVMAEGIPAWIPKEDAKRQANGMVKILPLSTFAFSQPDLENSEVIGALFAGDLVKRIRARNDWVRVRLPERTSAWIKQSDLDVLSATL